MATIKFTLIVIVALVGIMSLDKVQGQGLKCLHCGGLKTKCTKDYKGVSEECQLRPTTVTPGCTTTFKDGEVFSRDCGRVAYTGCYGNEKDQICICTSSDNCNGDSGTGSGSDGKAGSGSDGKSGSGSDGNAGSGSDGSAGLDRMGNQVRDRMGNQGLDVCVDGLRFKF